MDSNRIKKRHRAQQRKKHGHDAELIALQEAAKEVGKVTLAKAKEAGLSVVRLMDGKICSIDPDGNITVLRELEKSPRKKLGLVKGQVLKLK